MTARDRMQVNDVVVVGVGGQGILLATDVIANVFIATGCDVKKSEVHGMAQRGGSVESHVRRRHGCVHSPLVSPGCADVLLSFERMEALRYANYVHSDGVVLYNTQKIPTLAIANGEVRYPSGIEQSLRKRCRTVLPVNAMDVAADLGNPRVANTVLLGALSHLTDIPAERWEEAIVDRVPRSAGEVNRRAFAAGAAVAKDLMAT